MLLTNLTLLWDGETAGQAALMGIFVALGNSWVWCNGDSDGDPFPAAAWISFLEEIQTTLQMSCLIACRKPHFR